MTNDNTSSTIDLNALQRQDKGAFSQFVAAHSDKIFRLALKMLGNVQDAEDVLLEECYATGNLHQSL